MPTYEYKCESCGIVFDRFQDMSDDPLTECPYCGGAVKRLIGAGAGVIFKGSGFYATDYNKSSCAFSGSCTKRAVCGDAKKSDSKK